MNFATLQLGSHISDQMDTILNNEKKPSYLFKKDDFFFLNVCLKVIFSNVIITSRPRSEICCKSLRMINEFIYINTLQCKVRGLTHEHQHVCDFRGKEALKWKKELLRLAKKEDTLGKIQSENLLAFSIRGCVSYKTFQLTNWIINNILSSANDQA